MTVTSPWFFAMALIEIDDIDGLPFAFFKWWIFPWQTVNVITRWYFKDDLILLKKCVIFQFHYQRLHNDYLLFIHCCWLYPQ